MSETDQIVQAPAGAHFQKLRQLLERMAVTDGEGATLSLETGVARAVTLIREARTAGGTVLLVGNGGSAGIASHMHNDLNAAVGVRAMVFTETPWLTALANDHGYPAAYERAAAHWARPGDLLVAISSSGRSENILRAAAAVRNAGGRVLTLSGFDPDNPLRRAGEINWYVASHRYGEVEPAHAVLAHYLTDRARPEASGP